MLGQRRVNHALISLMLRFVNVMLIQSVTWLLRTNARLERAKIITP